MSKNKAFSLIALLILTVIHIVAILFVVYSGLPVTNKIYAVVLLCSLLTSFCFFWGIKESKNRLRNIILTDELTGLPTLKKFKSECEEKLRHATSDEYAVINLDINNFHYIKETLGHSKANLVLMEIAEHFKSVKVDSDLLCRNYSDNFLVLTRGSCPAVIEDIVSSFTDVESKLEKILPAYYNMDFSCGVYFIKNPKEKIHHILEKVQKARMEGKHSLRSEKIYYYDEEIGKNKEIEKELTLDMNRAFEDREFIVYYQPKFRFSDNQVVGAEALIRWNHKNKGMISPANFIPLFEQNGFIEKIDFMVFERVCQFLHEWNKSGPNGTCPYPITISCNLSRIELNNPQLAKIYSQIASQYDIFPSKIEIELTESMMYGNKKQLLAQMNKIKDAGFSISVDDFGSGYSSLNLLKSIPADVIKLDKEFFAPDGVGGREQIIVKSIIDMAKKLNMVTVAEGVEDKEKSDLLKSLGCDICQGYYFARPMPENEYKDVLHKLLG